MFFSLNFFQEEVANPFFGTPQRHCGSEPARDYGVSANINVECDIAIASRLAPTEGA